MSSNVTKKIIGNPSIKKIIRKAKTATIKGLHGKSIFEVVQTFIQGIIANSLTTRASSLAFRFFLAIFPSIIFLFSLIPYIPIENFQEELFKLIQKLLPTNAYELTSETILDLISNKNDGLLSFGFLFALFLASDGINYMISAFQESYHIKNKASFVKQRIISLLLLLVLTLLMSVAIGAIVFSEIIFDTLISYGILKHDYMYYLLTIGKTIILILLFLSGISFTYHYGGMNSSKFKLFSIGAILATGLTILLAYGFAIYVNNFSSYNKIYGSIGTLMVIMLWLYFNSLVLLIGFELNAVINKTKNT